MSFIERTTVDILSTSYNSVRIRINYPWSNSYFGICNNAGAVAMKSWDGYLHYVGWPTSGHWKQKWGSPDARLKNGNYINLWAGNLTGMLMGTGLYGTYSIETTVPLPGNKRQNNRSITVGLEYRGNDSRFSTPLTTVTLYGTAIPRGTINEFTSSADKGDVSGDRYIRIRTSFTNPSNFHYCRLTDSNGKLLATSHGTTLNHNILITKDMYQTTKSFTASLYGDDGELVSQKTTYVSIEPSGAGLWFTPTGSGFVEISKSAFKNTKNKDIKEVWVKINGKWRKTKK